MRKTKTPSLKLSAIIKNAKPSSQIESPLEDEVDAILDITKSTLEEIACQRWIMKSKLIKKLEAKSKSEFENRGKKVKSQQIVSHVFSTKQEKLSSVINELTRLSFWRVELLPPLLKQELTEVPKLNTPFEFASHNVFLLLSLETTYINLIEKMLNYSKVIEMLNEESVYDRHHCFSSQVNKAIFHKLLADSDTPMLLAEILVKKPWRRLDMNGQEEQYTRTSCGSSTGSCGVGGPQWKPVVEPDFRRRIEKIEFHTWTALHSIFSTSKNFSIYEFTKERQVQFVKLHGLLNATVLTQHPKMKQFKIWLAKFRSFDVKPSSNVNGGGGDNNESVAEKMVPFTTQFRNVLEVELDEKKDSILQMHKEFQTFRSADSANLEQVLRRPKLNQYVGTCANCGKSFPSLRCSACHFELYCGKECQEHHWHRHKIICVLF